VVDIVLGGWIRVNPVEPVLITSCLWLCSNGQFQVAHEIAQRGRPAVAAQGREQAMGSVHRWNSTWGRLRSRQTPVNGSVHGVLTIDKGIHEVSQLGRRSLPRTIMTSTAWTQFLWRNRWRRGESRGESREELQPEGTSTRSHRYAKETAGTGMGSHRCSTGTHPLRL